MSTWRVEPITGSHGIERVQMAAMRPRSGIRPSRPRAALGRTLVAMGLRLSMPAPRGARHRIREMLRLGDGTTA